MNENDIKKIEEKVADGTVEPHDLTRVLTAFHRDFSKVGDVLRIIDLKKELKSHEEI